MKQSSKYFEATKPVFAAAVDRYSQTNDQHPKRYFRTQALIHYWHLPRSNHHKDLSFQTHEQPPQQPSISRTDLAGGKSSRLSIGKRAAMVPQLERSSGDSRKNQVPAEAPSSSATGLSCGAGPKPLPFPWSKELALWFGRVSLVVAPGSGTAEMNGACCGIDRSNAEL